MKKELDTTLDIVRQILDQSEFDEYLRISWISIHQTFISVTQFKRYKELQNKVLAEAEKRRIHG